MNCFQIFLSSWWFATVIPNNTVRHKLWIAFKFFYLRDGSQPTDVSALEEYRCELLSNFSIFVMVRNDLATLKRPELVVNCFQIFLSSWWFATNCWMMARKCRLWIAFKFFYLRDGSQLYDNYFCKHTCCELLSNFSIFVIVRNQLRNRIEEIYVVNCFQIFLSSWLEQVDLNYRNVVNCFQIFLSSWWFATTLQVA